MFPLKLLCRIVKPKAVTWSGACAASVVSSLLMSACLRRAPWRRSAGWCWTAKGASSAEVRPRLALLVPEAANTTARHDATASCRRTNRRNAPVLSPVSALKRGRTRCRARFNAPFFPETHCHSRTSHATRILSFWFLLEEIKMSQSPDWNDTDEAPDPLTHAVTAESFLCRQPAGDVTSLCFLYKHNYDVIFILTGLSRSHIHLNLMFPLKKTQIFIYFNALFLKLDYSLPIKSK